MSNPNPHRFPRPPTLPQSKIQIQTQRDQNPAELGHPTFATMTGKTRGQSSAAGKDEAVSPGSFTTSFDLFSIAKMIPAKQRRVGNAAGNEGQAEDMNTAGESPAEASGMYGDWRKQPSTTAMEPPRTPEIAKAMVFKRTIAIPSSRLSRRTQSIFGPDEIQGSKNQEPTTTREQVRSFLKDDSLKFFESKNTKPNASTENTGETPEPSQMGNSCKALNVPNAGLPPHQQKVDESNERIEDSQQEGRGSRQNKKDPEDIFGGNVQMRNSGKRMDPTAMFRPMTPMPLASRPEGCLAMTMSSTRGLNDSSGILRAVAVPFEPKQAPNQDPPNIQVGTLTPIADTRPKSSSQLDPFDRLPENSHEESSRANSGSLSHAAGVRKQPSNPIQWNFKETNQATEIEGNKGPFGAPGDNSQKKSSLDNSGVSRLWDFSRNGGSKQTVTSEPLSQDLIEIITQKKTPLPPREDLSSILPSNGQLSRQITVRGEAMEQLVPIPRNSSTSDLRVVERLEKKAMVLSESESDIVKTFMGNDSASDPIQSQTAKEGSENPIPKTEQRGRRGDINMQGTTLKKPVNNDATDGRLKNLTVGALGEELMSAKARAEWLKKWLEPGETEIHIKKGENREGAGPVYWPYPYAPTDMTEKDMATELFLKLRDSLLEYTSLADPEGTKTGKDCWSFGNSESASTPGEKPWISGDNKSFFEMSFGVNFNRTTGRAITYPPGLPLPAKIRAQQGDFGASAQIGPGGGGGLRDLVESSTPDFVDYNDDTRKPRAKTIHEWNSTPIRGGTPVGSIQKYTGATGKGGKSTYEKTGVKAGVNGRRLEGPRSTPLMSQSGLGARFGVGMVGSTKNGDTGLQVKVQSQSLDGRARRQKMELREEPFGGVRNLRKLVFGSDEEETV